ncbi:DUF695 domain-containing protein [Mucilaginibacter sp. OK268]|uniref:DUF695 domain-containing protein n=1 Tax=Mucilaginibacter sp. OK268 TaxID=1881048 RepID=UPI000B868E9D|nr:DUF695 domain-containing protein [Mucilaginibacter sp. OK268]
MSLLKSIFKKKETPIKTYDDFWSWFRSNEKSFFNVIKQQGDIEKEFFSKLSPKLNELKSGFFFLTGMMNDNTAELILTADGNIKNINFVEELVAAAPEINGWKLTALKPPSNIQDTYIEMAGYKFSSDNIWFYPNNNEWHPDEIDVTIIHPDLNENNRNDITNGVYIFLDNFLGELNFVTTIDNLNVVGNDDVEAERVPIEKLNDYLIWREKEFVEKYEGVRHDTEQDSYSAMEAELKSGNKLLAIINMDLLKWESKASHPWILNIEIKYDGSRRNGMPDERTYQLLSIIEDEIMADLKDYDGYLNIGRQTADGIREIYFACKDFRKPSAVLYRIQQKYGVALDYDIYKDKYWQSFDRFIN